MTLLLVFPAAAFLLFSIIFFRGFSRTTGMSVKLFNLTAYLVPSVGITLAAFFILSGMKQLAPQGFALPIKTFASPLMEEVLKFTTIFLLQSIILPAGERLQVYRQRILAGIIVGMGFGLMETYLYIVRQIELLSSIIIFGSLPLHMVTGGFLGLVIASKKQGSKRIFYIFIITLGHILYNQILVLPLPLSYSSLLILLLGSMLLLNLLTAPRIPDSEEE